MKVLQSATNAAVPILVSAPDRFSIIFREAIRVQPSGDIDGPSGNSEGSTRTALSREVVRGDPKWTINKGARLLRCKRPEDAEYMFDGLRKAGLPG